MSVYTDRKNFFKLLSQKHYMVKHDAIEPDSGGMKRKSFIAIDNPEELAAAVINQGHFPMVVHTGFEGKPVDKNGSIRIRNINELLFLDKPQTTELDITVTSANDAAFNRSFAVMMDFISYMYETYEEYGACGPFKDIDLSLFNWRVQEYIEDGIVGWVLSFIDEVSANDILSFNPAKWIEGLLTEDGNPILTEDGNDVLTD